VGQLSRRCGASLSQPYGPSWPVIGIPKETEINTIRNILQNNEYNTYLVESPPPQKQNIHPDPQHQKTKWATFTYCSKEVRKITKLFKNMQIKIAFRTKIQFKIY
jgi:hypothetical protein